MAIFKKKTTLSKEESLLCIPEKNDLVKEEHLESGDMILEFSVMYKPFFSKIQNVFQANPKKTFQRKIQLDALGIHVWNLINGKDNVKTIIKKFADMHTLNIKEAEISVTLFLKSLGEKGLILIKHVKK